MPRLTRILLIRHAEKPSDPLDPGLSAAGDVHALAYVAYFRNHAIDGAVIKLTHLFAAANSRGSNRSTLTLAPLAAALGIAVDTRFDDHGFQLLADEILGHDRYDSSNILVCWHHGQALNLAHALGAPTASLPAVWPDDVFGWLLQLSFDASGACTGLAIDQETGERPLP